MDNLQQPELLSDIGILFYFAGKFDCNSNLVGWMTDALELCLQTELTSCVVFFSKWLIYTVQT